MDIYTEIESYYKQYHAQGLSSSETKNALSLVNIIRQRYEQGEESLITAHLHESHAHTANTKNTWHVHQSLKKAILLYIYLQTARRVTPTSFDKIELYQPTDDILMKKKIRMVPGSIVRSFVYLADSLVLMPSFINIGASVGEGSMVDTWVTIGSCAQIGKHCHISGGVGIGGVLEPINANPVIIEDHVFIGARSEIAEGLVVGRGSVIGMGTMLGQGTKIIDRNTGKQYKAFVPPESVVVPGSYVENGIGISCGVIVKYVTDTMRSKLSVNEILHM